MTESTGPFIMAIDVGVTNVKAGLVDSKGQIFHFEQRDTPVEKGAGGVANILVETCRNVLSQAGLSTKDLVAVGCCTPGCVNPETGVIMASATPSWVGVDVRGPLENSFERTVTVEGDGGASALAFYTFGPTRQKDHLLGISIGTGISAGYVVGGELLRGAGQAAMEAGHMPLFFRGRPCSCGKQGCWEAHAGGGPLRTLLKEYRAAGHELPTQPEELAELALAGQQTAISIWEEQGTLLGLGIAVLLNVLNPKTVVLGGGVAQAWSLFKKSLLKAARNHALSRNAEAAIVCAPDPQRAPLLGAAVAAVRAQDVPGGTDFFVDAVSSGA